MGDLQFARSFSECQFRFVSPEVRVAVELACRMTSMTQRAIGAHYGAISSGAVSNIRRRLRQGEYAIAEIVAELCKRIISSYGNAN
jgi:hypothetical protein